MAQQYTKIMELAGEWSAGFITFANAHPAVWAFIFITILIIYTRGNLAKYNLKLDAEEKTLLNGYKQDTLRLITTDLELLEQDLNSNVDSKLRSIIQNDGEYNCPYLASSVDGVLNCTSMIQKADICVMKKETSEEIMDVYKNKFKHQIDVYHLVLRCVFLKEVPEFVNVCLSHNGFKSDTDLELQRYIDDSADDIATIIKKTVSLNESKAPCILDNDSLAADIDTIRHVYKGIIQSHLLLKKNKNGYLAIINKKREARVINIVRALLGAFWRG
jgi:hypothetical protein